MEANQNARKLLSTDLVNTKRIYSKLKCFKLSILLFWILNYFHKRLNCHPLTLSQRNEIISDPCQVCFADKLILGMPKRWVFHLLKGFANHIPLFAILICNCPVFVFSHVQSIETLFLPKNHRAALPVLWWIFETFEIILREVSL